MFQIGDKVVCVNDEPMGCPHGKNITHKGGNAPKRGSVSIISNIRQSVLTSGSLAGQKCGCVDIVVNGLPVNASRFRKIQPCEPEFIELLKRIKPKVDA